MQKLLIETMARSDKQDSYLSIITSYVGSCWGVLLGALYSITMLKSMVECAFAITNDSVSYLKTFGLTTQTLSEHWWWSLLLIAGLSLIASKGEKLLFKVSGSMIAVKLVIIVAVGFVVIHVAVIFQPRKPLKIGIDADLREDLAWSGRTSGTINK